MKKMRILLVLTGLLVSRGLLAQLQPTHLTIRVKAKDASPFGPHHADKYGAVFVRVKDAVTGKLVTSGQLGGEPADSGLAGNTGLAGGRYDSVKGKKTGRFDAVIPISEPTLVTAEVVAPTKKRNAAASRAAGNFSYPVGESVVASAQIWLIPGRDIDGEGEVIEIPGFILDIQAPAGGQAVRLDSLSGQVLAVNVSLTMMCGCKITPGGRWNSDNIEVAGYLKRDGKRVGNTVFQIKDTSRYQGVFGIREKGKYELTVSAYDRVSKNTGVDRVSFKVD